ncbi:phage integrase family protein [Synechococcus sp. RS9902]|nr:phage integrase family protein [Synechococcus sp. RS9902]
MAPKGNFKSDKQHSGTPGLIQRGNGKWAVKVNFTKEEQAAWLKVRRERKRYIQVSLRTDSLELARQTHPEELLKIRKEISQVMVASGNLDQLHPTERLKYGVGRAYQELIKPQSEAVGSVPPPDGVADMLREVTTSHSDSDAGAGSTQLLVSRQQELREAMNQGIAIAMLREQGIDATPENLSLAEQSLAFAIEQASETLSDRAKRGVFAVESPAHQQLTEAAAVGEPVVMTAESLTVWDLLKAYADHNRENTKPVVEKRERLTREWVEFIGGDSVALVTSKNLVKYHSHLADLMYANRAKKVKDPLALKTEHGVNSKAKHVKMLVNMWNKIQAGQPDEQLPIVDFMLLKQSEASKKEAKLKERTKATTDEAKIGLLKQALTEAENLGKDKRPEVLGARHGTWKALLLMDNTTLRRCEISMLQWKHIVKVDGVWCVDVMISKTAAGIRRIPMNETLQRVLLPLKKKVANDEAFVVDNAAQTNDVPEAKISNWCRTRGTKLGIADRVNPHSWRHDAGGDLGTNVPEGVKKALMGHAGDVTQQYWSENLAAMRDYVEVLGTHDEALLQRMEALVSSEPKGPHPFALMGIEEEGVRSD